MNEQARPPRFFWPVAATVVGLAGLAGALWSLREPQYWDAAFYVPLANAIREHPARLLLDSQPIVNTPLQGILIALGWVVTGRNLWVPHAVSLVSAVVVLIGAYRLVWRERADGFAAFSAVAMLLAVPLFQSQARLALPEMLAGACTMLAVLALARDRETEAGLWIALSVFAKFNAAGAVPLLGLWAAWRAHLRRPPEAPRSFRALAVSFARVALPGAITVVAWLAYHYVITDGMTFSHTGDGLFASALAGEHRTIGSVLHRIWERVRQLGGAAGLGPLAVGAFVVIVAARPRVTHRTVQVAILCVLPTLGYLPVLAVTGVPLPRYITPTLGPLVVGLVLIASLRGRRWLACAVFPSVAVALSLMWDSVPRRPLTVGRLGLVAGVASIGVAVIARWLARSDRIRWAAVPLAAAGAVLLFAHIWTTSATLEPESNLGYKALLARDQRVIGLVERAWQRDRATPLTATPWPPLPFPYNLYTRLPYLGWVGQRIPFVDEDDVPCRYYLISRPDALEGRRVLKELGRVKPSGEHWSDVDIRVAALVDCGDE